MMEIKELNPMVKTAYGKEAANSYNVRRFTTRAGKKIHETELQILKAAMDFVPIGSRVLEVGCGTGRLLLSMCEVGYMVDGTDTSAYMLAQCRKKIKCRFPETKLILAEAARLKHLDNSYDLVYCIRLLNQTESSEYALDAIADMIRVAKHSGYILVEFVNYYRPRLGKKRGVYLKPREVINRANECNATKVWYRGAFFLGMTTYHVLPGFLTDLVNFIDRSLSWLFPRLCSRCYILFRRKRSK